MEDLEKRAIEDLSVVSSVGFHAGGKTHKAGVYANLRCCAASSYGGCGAKLVGPIRKSIERPTTVDCFRELFPRCGSNLVAQVMGKVRWMVWGPW